MKKICSLSIFVLLFFITNVFAQVGIGTNSPDSSAILELQSTQRGFLPPRMTTEQRDSIQNPAIGLIIYNLDCHCVNFFNGDHWMEYGRDPVESFNCGQVLTDSRTGNSYNTLQAGSQCWMAENLDVGNMINSTETSSDNGILEKYCYGNAPGNCSKYGGLYRWDELMQYDTNRYNQGICPEGWHLPNSDEWDTLINHYGGQSTAGVALREEGTSGFEALLAGGMKPDGSFHDKGTKGYFWSSALSSSGSAWSYHLAQGDNSYYKQDTSTSNAYSVRCIKGYENRVDTGVVVIDSTVYTLISDSTELAQGIYKYTFGTRSREDIIVSEDIIVGLTGEGYIRKVNGISQNRNQLILETSQATMEDVFVSGEFNSSVSIGDTNMNSRNGWSRTRIVYLAKGVNVNQTRDGFVFGLQNVTLFQNSYVTLVGNGNMLFDPDFDFDFKFRENQVKKLGFSAMNAPLINNIDLTLSVNAGFEDTTEIVLASYERYFGFMAGFIPVVGVVRIDLKAKNILSFNAPIEASIGYTNSNSISFGVLYENGTWSKIWNVEKNNTFHPLTIDIGEFDITQKFEIVPEASVKFYGVAGPYFNMSGYEVMDFAYSIPTLDWNSDIKVGLASDIGAEVTIFGLTLAQYNKQLFGFESTLWETPKSLEIISGNNQTGTPGQQLPNPLRVRVKDSRGKTFANVPVHFAITSGGGSVEGTDVMTDADGYAQTNWTLGVTGSQEVSVSVLKANGDNISGSPKEFTANTSGSSSCGGSITINHVAGNVAPVTKSVTYGTVLGIPGEPTKCWITSNLGADHQATAVDDATESSAGWYWQFNRKQGYKHDGTTRTPNTAWIYPIDDNFDWQSENDPCIIELSNGWRLPTITEWNNVDAVGNWDNWNGPWNSALKIHAAGSFYMYDGSLLNRGSYGGYWSNSQSSSETIRGGGLYFGSSGGCGINYGFKADGNSVRCIKDNQTSNGEPCPGTPTVSYEDQVYNTVQIGTQCWLKENLNVGTRIDGTTEQTDNSIIEKYCYDDLEANCDIYGGLYQWDEIMQYVTTEGAQGICPTGWHIPKNGEWYILSTFLGGENAAGGMMKSTGTLEAGSGLWYAPNLGATNESGFTSLPSGDCSPGSFFSALHIFSTIHSSSENSETDVWVRRMIYYQSVLYSGYSAKSAGLSVRCLKNY